MSMDMNMEEWLKLVIIMVFVILIIRSMIHG